MAFSLAQLFTPQTADQWEQSLLTTLNGLGLTTTAWQSGGMARTLIRALAVSLATGDTLVATAAQGGFLDFAAATSVTPDPSITIGAAPGWLDILADSVYNVQRIPATFAPGNMQLTSTAATPMTTFAVGQFHVANPTTKATYSNTAAFTIPVGPAVTTVAFAADVAGSSGTSVSNSITQSITVVTGVTVNNAFSFVGSDPESNTRLVARCRLKLASLSPNGAGDAYRYFALTAATLLAAQTPALTLAGGTITRALVTQNTSIGTVTLTIANATPSASPQSPSGSSLQLVSGATNATPIVVSTALNHGMNNGDTAIITGVLGNAAANGTFSIQVVTANSFSLFLLGTSTPVAGSGAYTGGGSAECGDVGLVDTIIQKNCVPDSVTANTQPATPVGIVFVTDVWVPSANASAVSGVVTTAVTNYISNLPIGGLTVNSPNIVPFDAVLSAIISSANYIQQATLTMNGSTSDITLLLSPIPQVATVTSVTVNVHPV